MSRARALNMKDWQVRALLDGRLSQVRVPVWPQPSLNHSEVGCCQSDWRPIRDINEGAMWDFCTSFEPGNAGGPWRCPLGQPGDLLWVRETWAPCGLIDECDPPEFIRYRADESCWSPDGPVDDHGHDSPPARWRPSTQMPRWASRLTLELVDVRVERVQEISEDDTCSHPGAIDWYSSLGPVKEARVSRVGFKRSAKMEDRNYHKDFAPGAFTLGDRCVYSLWWDSQHAKRGLGWDSNPWVWVGTVKAAAAAGGV